MSLFVPLPLNFILVLCSLTFAYVIAIEPSEIKQYTVDKCESNVDCLCEIDHGQKTVRPCKGLRAKVNFGGQKYREYTLVLSDPSLVRAEASHFAVSYFRGLRIENMKSLTAIQPFSFWGAKLDSVSVRVTHQDFKIESRGFVNLEPHTPGLECEEWYGFDRPLTDCYSLSIVIAGNPDQRPSELLPLSLENTTHVHALRIVGNIKGRPDIFKAHKEVKHLEVGGNFLESFGYETLEEMSKLETVRFSKSGMKWARLFSDPIISHNLKMKPNLRKVELIYQDDETVHIDQLDFDDHLEEISIEGGRIDGDLENLVENLSKLTLKNVTVDIESLLAVVPTEESNTTDFVLDLEGISLESYEFARNKSVPECDCEDEFFAFWVENSDHAVFEHAGSFAMIVDGKNSTLIDCVESCQKKKEKENEKKSKKGKSSKESEKDNGSVVSELACVSALLSVLCFLFQ